MIHKILDDIANEMKAQDKKWGAQRDLNPHVWNTILSEETGEYAEAILDHDEIGMYTEIIQVAAVAIQIAERIKSHGLGDK